LSSFYFGIFGFGLNFISKKTRFPLIVVAPVLWVSLEYARSNAGFLAHPQMLMGHSQYLNLPIIQISGFTGAYGVSFLIVMVNVAISEIIQNRKKAFKPIIATGIVMGITLAFGFIVLAKGHGRDTVSITVIQGNIPQIVDFKKESLLKNLNKYVWLTKEALNDNHTSLIVWPENTIVSSIKQDRNTFQIISNLAKETKSKIIFGISHRPKSKVGNSGVNKGERFNSAMLISKEGKLEGRYNKHHLVPFAEYIPYGKSFPWPSMYVSKASNFTAGTEYTIFNLDDAKFGTLICWENIYPELFRRVVKNGANFMLNITNEVLLGETAVSYQIAAISVFRAVENSISIARSANTGISCFINPHGKIVGRVHDHNNNCTFVEGYLTKEVPLTYKRTFYTMYGDVFMYMNIAMAAFLIGLSFFRGKKEVLTLPGLENAEDKRPQRSPR
jgi:apolipoprotein N-acyltransferase